MPTGLAGGETDAWGFAPETRLYIGGSLGAADQNEFEDGNNGAGKVFAGIRYRAVGAEVSYLQVGKAKDKGLMPRDPSFTSDIHGQSATAVAYLPLNLRTELIGKLGAAYWAQTNSREVVLTEVKSESDDQGLSPLLGIGVQYRLYQNINLRSEWERIFSAGEGDYESDIDILSIGISLSTL